jgi:hypothetical protein
MKTLIAILWPPLALAFSSYPEFKRLRRKGFPRKELIIAVVTFVVLWAAFSCGTLQWGKPDNEPLYPW